MLFCIAGSIPSQVQSFFGLFPFFARNVHKWLKNEFQIIFSDDFPTRAILFSSGTAKNDIFISILCRKVTRMLFKPYGAKIQIRK